MMGVEKEFRVSETSFLGMDNFSNSDFNKSNKDCSCWVGSTYAPKAAGIDDRITTASSPAIFNSKKNALNQYLRLGMFSFVNYST